MTRATARTFLALTLALAAAVAFELGAAEDGEHALLPEAERAFLDDGPAWLVPEADRKALLAMDSDKRAAWIEAFLARDPVAATSDNELVDGIERRQGLVLSELNTFLDDRARMLFLQGKPIERVPIRCDQTFKPLEIWWYGPRETTPGYVLYEPRPGNPYRLWLPLDSKRVLYGSEMESWLEEVAEITGGKGGPRFDKRLCKQAEVVDRATGVYGLFDFQEDRPTNDQIRQILAPPEDLGAWAAAAYVTSLPDAEAPIRLAGPPEVYFPEVKSQRMRARLLLRLPEAAGIEIFRENEKAEVRLKVDGVVEHENELFEEFHIRYQVPVTGEEAPPLVLLLDRLLRPGEPFLVRLKVHDEIGGGEARANLGFRVPLAAQAAADLPADVVVAQGVDVEPERVAGIDSLVIVPPETDVVLGLWRVETLISGERIGKVIFLVDGKPQYTKTAAPFQAEVRLAKYPTEQVVRVEGYDSTDQLVAFDEVVLNQQRGQLEVRITEPKRGVATAGSVRAKASIVVPEERKLERVEFLVDDKVTATLAKPPWEADVPVPEASKSDVHYITVAAYLDDGTRAEDVQFLNHPDYLEEVEVDLVELYTTIEGQAPAELPKEEFSVFEDGRPQQIVKFELVRDLPITIGVTIDTSGSMIESIGEAKRAAIDFLQSIVTPKDQVFAVSFSNHPVLLMTRTSDVAAVAKAIDGLHAVGNTSLHDAVVTSLYYFRGVRGRRALVLLSDGEDTSSTIQFKDALDYARRSGVVIYPIGLNIGMTAIGVRDKLNNLAQVTGGRSFYISKAVELETVYDQIEEELRSQYLIAYASDAPRESNQFRTVEVKTKGKFKARTIAGYYP